MPVDTSDTCDFCGLILAVGGIWREGHVYNNYLIQFILFLPGAKQRILIPILYKSCKIPTTLMFIQHLNYTTEHGRKFFWDRLVASLGYKNCSSLNGKTWLAIGVCFVWLRKKKHSKAGKKWQGWRRMNYFWSEWVKKQYLLLMAVLFVCSFSSLFASFSAFVNTYIIYFQFSIKEILFCQAFEATHVCL